MARDYPIHWFTVPVGPSDWIAAFSTPEATEDLRNGDGVAEGSSNQDTSRIYLHAGIPADRRPDVFIHELLHSVISVVGIDKALNLSDAKEETLVSLLAPTLTDALLRSGLLRLPRAPKLPKRKRKPKGADVEVTMLDAKASKGARR